MSPHSLWNSLRFIFSVFFLLIFSRQLDAQTPNYFFNEKAQFQSDSLNPKVQHYFGTTLEVFNSWIISTGKKKANEEYLDVYFIKTDSSNDKILETVIFRLENLIIEEYQISTAVNDSFYFISGLQKDPDLGQKSFVKIYKLNPQDQWTTYQTITPEEGSPVSDLAVDREHLLIGCPEKDYTINGSVFLKNAGTSALYKLEDGLWQFAQNLRANKLYEGDYYGEYLDIKGDSAVISSVRHSTINNNDFQVYYTGKVYLFIKNQEGRYILDSEINYSGDDNATQFGKSVQISKKGIFCLRNGIENRSNYICWIKPNTELVETKLDNKLFTYHSFSGFKVYKDLLYAVPTSGSIKIIDSTNRRVTHFIQALVFSTKDQIKYAGMIAGKQASSNPQIAIKNGYIYSSNPKQNVLNIDSHIVYNAGLIFKFSSDTYVSHVDSLTFIACDRYTAPSRLKIWEDSGIYLDSVINDKYQIQRFFLDLTIGHTTYAKFDATACDSFMAPNGDYIKVLGKHVVTIPNQLGCDSVITVNFKTLLANADLRFEDGQLIAETTGQEAYRWINCTKNEFIDGATGSTYMPTVPGFYALEVQNQACINRSSCIYIDAKDIETYTLPGTNLNVYPNPASRIVTVDLYQSANRVKVEIYSLEGAFLGSIIARDKSKVSIELPSSKGLYILKIKVDNDAAIMVKVIRQ